MSKVILLYESVSSDYTPLLQVENNNGMIQLSVHVKVLLTKSLHFLHIPHKQNASCTAT